MRKILIDTLYMAGTPTGACFSIVIPTWNNLSYLKTCIESIRKNSAYPHQILVHVNEGIDNSVAWLKSQEITHSWSAQNVGVCASLNHLATLANTNYILYLNDDMYVAKDWDKALLIAIQEREDKYFYFSGTMVENKSTGNKAVISPYNFGDTNIDFKEDDFLNFAATHKSADWWGACWPPSIVHKDLWMAVEGYDEAYSPGFYSDPDFAMKLWKLGVRDFRGIAACKVYHFRCKSTGRITPNDGRKTFAAKWRIPASFLYKNILKMGEPVYEGVKLKTPNAMLVSFAKIRAWFILRS